MGVLLRSSTRWLALNHVMAVNRLDQPCRPDQPPGANPTAESDEQLYAFFEHFLKTYGPFLGR